MSEYVPPAPNQYYELGPRTIPRYEIHDGHIDIDDPVWGNERIGHKPYDTVLLELADNDLVRRAMAIEQLTLDQYTATIPGTANFARWEHIWGSVVFVRKMTESMNMDPQQRMVLQLRTFLSDLGHTAFSHLGDWMFQGVGGSEDQHDKDLLDLLEASGITDVLKRHGFDSEEVVFPVVQDWVETAAPDLCVDRVDYAAREMQRWLDVDMKMHDMLSQDSFELIGNQIVMKDLETAKLFGKGFLLLVSEHWQEPVHRLQLFLLQELVERVTTARNAGLLVASMDMPDQYHPRDYMYAIDKDILGVTHERDDFMQVVLPIAHDIGLRKRQSFAYERLDHLSNFLRQDTDVYPHPLQYYDYFAERNFKYPLLPANISIVPVENRDDVSDFGANPYAVDFFLTQLKPRYVDPLYKDGEAIRRLSEVDPNYATLLVQQRAVVEQRYVARIHVNTETKRIIEQGMRHNDQAWQEALQRPRMSPERFRQLLHDAAMYSVPTRMIDLQWHR